MKKLFAFSLALLMAVSAFGQSIKVTPALRKGVVKTYISSAALSAMDQKINISSELKFTIVKETTEGYEMTMETTAYSSDAKDDNLLSRLVTLGEEIMKGVKVQIRLNKAGKPLGIINYQEVKEKSVITASRIVDELFQAAPELSNVMKKEEFMKQVTDDLTPDKFIQSLTASTSPLALFGRTITSGMEDKYNNNMVDLKRVWLVTGKVIGASSKTDMSREETKNFIISAVQKSSPQQVDIIKENIDQVLDSGLFKLDMSEKTKYELSDDLWLKSIENDMESDIMGQKTSSHTKIQLKN